MTNDNGTPPAFPSAWSESADHADGYKLKKEHLKLFGLLAVTSIGSALVATSLLSANKDHDPQIAEYLVSNHCTPQTLKGFEVRSFECGKSGARTTVSADAIFAIVRAQVANNKVATKPVAS